VDGTNDHFNSIKAQLLHFDMELKSLWWDFLNAYLNPKKDDKQFIHLPHALLVAWYNSNACKLKKKLIIQDNQVSLSSLIDISETKIYIEKSHSVFHYLKNNYNNDFLKLLPKN
jgi:hypothetical protein